jgi:hypothetical protein
MSYHLARPLSSAPAPVLSVHGPAIDLQKMNWEFRTGVHEHTGVSLKEPMPDNPRGAYTRVHQDTGQSRDGQSGASPAPRRLPTDLPPSVFGYLLANQLVKLFQTLWCRHVICSFYSCVSPYLAIKWLKLPFSYLPMFSASYDVGRRHPTNFLLID